jgi:hypothetical protein
MKSVKRLIEHRKESAEFGRSVRLIIVSRTVSKTNDGHGVLVPLIFNQGEDH